MILAFVAVGSCLALFAMVPVRFDFSFTTLFIGEGTEYSDLQEYVERFGSDINQIALVLEVEDVFTEPVLEELSRITEELELAPGGTQVLSITNAEHLILDSSGAIRQVPLIGDYRETPIETIRAAVMEERHVGGLLISDDSTTVAVLLKLGNERTNAACDDGRDNSGSGFTDCQDMDCYRNRRVDLCGVEGEEEGGARCTDSVDNDGDGTVDCADPSCDGLTVCEAVSPAGESLCFDGQDDDRDGLIDCLDPDCQARSAESCNSVASVHQVVERSQARLTAAGIESRFELAGVPFVHEEYVRTVQHDQKTSMPVAGVVVAFMLWVVFRNVRGVIIPGAVVGLAIAWTAGFMMATGEYLNMINSVIPTLILVIGIADSIHIISRYRDELATRSHEESVRVTLRHMAPACLLTSVTSAVGFASLLTATLPIVKDFGTYAAIGIGFSFFLTVLLVPIAIYFFPWPQRTAKPRKNNAIDRLLIGLLAGLLRHPRRWGIVSLLVTVGICSGALLVHQNSRMMGELRDGSDGQRGNQLIEEKLFGVLSNAIIIRSESRNGLAQPEILNAMREIQGWVESQIDPHTQLAPVSHTISVADLVEDAHATWVGNEESRTIPDTLAGVVGLLDQLPSETRRRLISLDYRISHITMLSRDVGTRGWNPLREKLRDHIEEVFERRGLDETYSFAITGSSTLAQGAIGNIVDDLMTSILLAFVVILALMTLLFRSLRVGLMSMIPNTLPLLCTLGFIGYVGIPLRISTVIIFCVSLGIAVDDTIHFLARLREEQGRTRVFEEALQRTMKGTGRAILLTTILLVTGFLVLIASDFVAVHEMGILGAFTLTMALLGDLIVLPLLLIWFKPELDRGIRQSAEVSTANDIST